MPSATQTSHDGLCRSLHRKPQQAPCKGTTATASPSSDTADSGATQDHHIQVYSCPHSRLFPLLQCSATSINIHPYRVQLLLHLPHAGIFFLEVDNAHLLSLSISAYSNSLKLMASVRKPGNITRQTAKMPCNSHTTTPGVTICRRNTQPSSLSCSSW